MKLRVKEAKKTFLKIFRLQNHSPNIFDKIPVKKHYD